jgi:hypothetical protein
VYPVIMPKRLQPIETPDVNNSDQLYWETVLNSLGLSMDAGLPPRKWEDSDHPRLRVTLSVGGLNELVGVEEEQYRKRKGRRDPEGFGPDG